MSEVRIVPANDKQLELVRDSWVKSYRKHGARWLMHSGDFRGHVERTLAQSKVLVADVPEVPEAGVIGWSASEPRLLHYAYVLRSYRGNGVYRELLVAAGFVLPGTVVCTHYTVACEKMARWLEYRPSLIRR